VDNDAIAVSVYYKDDFAEPFIRIDTQDLYFMISPEGAMQLACVLMDVAHAATGDAFLVGYARQQGKSDVEIEEMMADLRDYRRGRDIEAVMDLEEDESDG
jgi:hypothetical protein